MHASAQCAPQATKRGPTHLGAGFSFARGGRYCGGGGGWYCGCACISPRSGGYTPRRALYACGCAWMCGFGMPYAAAPPMCAPCICGCAAESAANQLHAGGDSTAKQRTHPCRRPQVVALRLCGRSRGFSLASLRQQLVSECRQILVQRADVARDLRAKAPCTQLAAPEPPAGACAAVHAPGRLRLRPGEPSPSTAAA